MRAKVPPFCNRKHASSSSSHRSEEQEARERGGRASTPANHGQEAAGAMGSAAEDNLKRLVSEVTRLNREAGSQVRRSEGVESSMLALHRSPLDELPRLAPADRRQRHSILCPPPRGREEVLGCRHGRRLDGFGHVRRCAHRPTGADAFKRPQQEGPAQRVHGSPAGGASPEWQRESACMQAMRLSLHGGTPRR